MELDSDVAVIRHDTSLVIISAIWEKFAVIGHVNQITLCAIGNRPTAGPVRGITKHNSISMDIHVLTADVTEHCRYVYIKITSMFGTFVI